MKCSPSAADFYCRPFGAQAFSCIAGESGKKRSARAKCLGVGWRVQFFLEEFEFNELMDLDREFS